MIHSGVPDLNLSYTINNHSNSAIVVKHRGGVGYIVKGTTETNIIVNQELIVKVECNDIEQLELFPSEALTRIDAEIVKALMVDRNNYVNNVSYFNKRHTFFVTIKLGASFIDPDTDAIHSELFGFSLYSGIKNRDKLAVGTPRWTLNDVLNNTRELSDRSGALRMVTYINDPGRKFPPYFINMLGKVTSIPVIYDQDSHSGLYIVYLHSDRPQQNIYYAFEDINSKILDGLGIFTSKHDCEKGGNTERFVRAEEKLKETKKNLEQSYQEMENLKLTYSKIDEQHKNLIEELAELKHTHKVELDRLNYSYKTEITHLKQDLRMKDTMNKVSLDLARQKVAHTYWGDFAKAIGTLAGVGLTGYKLLTS